MTGNGSYPLRRHCIPGAQIRRVNYFSPRYKLPPAPFDGAVSVTYTDVSSCRVNSYLSGLFRKPRALRSPLEWSEV